MKKTTNRHENQLSEGPQKQPERNRNEFEANKHRNRNEIKDKSKINQNNNSEKSNIS